MGRVRLSADWIWEKPVVLYPSLCDELQVLLREVHQGVMDCRDHVEAQVQVLATTN